MSTPAANRRAGKAYRDRHRKLGLCLKCDEKAEAPGKSLCKRHADANRARQRTRDRRVALEAKRSDHERSSAQDSSRSQ